MAIPGKDEITRAHDRIRSGVHRTPVFTNATLDREFGTSIFFKPENLQKVGAFKARGALNAVLSLMEEGGVDHVATHSSGNHAQALALAAALAGIKATIVMPTSAPAVKKAAVLDYGADVVDCEPTLEARETTLAGVVERTGAVEVHPYNDYRVIAGQATAAKELLEDAGPLDLLFAPVGGGGLLSGSILSVNYFSPGTRVIAGEPEGADDAYRSLQAGSIIPSISPQTIADGLLTSLGDKTFPVIRDGVAEIVRVSEDEILTAMKWLWERMKLVVEPSGAVSLAAALKRSDLISGKRVGVILSGGNLDVAAMLDHRFR